MPFAAIDQLACVKAAHARHLRSLDALRVETACRRMFVSSSLLPDLRPQRVVYALPDTRIAPLPKVTINRVIGREIVWQHTPLNARLGDVKKGIDYFTQIRGAMASTSFCWRQQIFDTLPLLVR